ncbi:MAG: hypothetical protein ACPGVK_08685 [Halocynthiibacter sp.]
MPATYSSFQRTVCSHGSVFSSVWDFLEVDEPHHATPEGKLDDRHRTDDIVHAADLIEKRIAIYDANNAAIKTISKVAQEVDSFLKEIQSLKRKAVAEGKFEPWDFDARFDPEQHIERGYLSISANPVFMCQHEALRCFGSTGGPYQRGAWRLSSDPERSVWFPRLYETKEWANELEPDGKTIIERKKDGTKFFEKEKWKSRIVCARYRDNLGITLYRFIGEF